jgi:hypothetical protein
MRRVGRGTALGPALLALVLLGLAGCGDDDGAAPEATTTSAPASTTTDLAVNPTADDAIATVRSFAEDQVGMVDPVVELSGIDEGTPRQATVEVRTRREGGAEDPTLTPTVVQLVEDGDVWRIDSATSEFLTFDSPPPGTRLIAGFVTPSGFATAFEGTVIVQALLDGEVLGDEIATAEGSEDAFWAARVELGTEARGEGYILAFTTAGTEQGPPVFALVPVAFGAE